MSPVFSLTVWSARPRSSEDTLTAKCPPKTAKSFKGQGVYCYFGELLRTSLSTPLCCVSLSHQALRLAVPYVASDIWPRTFLERMPKGRNKQETTGTTPAKREKGALTADTVGVECHCKVLNPNTNE